MLLSTAIATQQNLYAEIQVQIEALQEKQRHIQAYLQRLGSIESKMESAAQLLQEAIADLRSECPDELSAYQELITGFFGGSPVAFLEAAVEVSEEPQANDAPQDEPHDATTEPTTVEATEVIATEEEQTEAVSQDDEKEPSLMDSDFSEVLDQAVEPTNQTHIITKGVETQPILPTSLQIDVMTKYTICKWLGDLGIEFKRSQPVTDLRTKLKAYILSQQAA